MSAILVIKYSEQYNHGEKAMTGNDKIFKSLKITEENYTLKVEGVFSDEFQEWLSYWMSDELTEALEKRRSEETMKKGRYQLSKFAEQISEEPLGTKLYYEVQDTVNKQSYRELSEIVYLLNDLQARNEVLEDNCLADTLTRKHLDGIIGEQQTTIERQAETIANIQKLINKCYNEECDSDE